MKLIKNGDNAGNMYSNIQLASFQHKIGNFTNKKVNQKLIICDTEAIVDLIA